jgi:hypothetical protein
VSAPAGLVELHLLRLPVALAARTRQHFEGLMREFQLIAASSAGDSQHQVPVRLTQLVDALTGQFAGVNTDADERLEDAMDQQVEEIEDHVLLLPAEAAEASTALGALIDEADEYCRQGEHLLTLASPSDCVAYREWYLGQVVSQLAGGQPISWPDSEQARSL